MPGLHGRRDSNLYKSRIIHLLSSDECLDESGPQEPLREEWISFFRHSDERELIFVPHVLDPFKGIEFLRWRERAENLRRKNVR